MRPCLPGPAATSLSSTSPSSPSGAEPWGARCLAIRSISVGAQPVDRRAGGSRSLLDDPLDVLDFELPVGAVAVAVQFPAFQHLLDFVFADADDLGGLFHVEILCGHSGPPGPRLGFIVVPVAGESPAAGDSTPLNSVICRSHWMLRTLNSAIFPLPPSIRYTLITCCRGIDHRQHLRPFARGRGQGDQVRRPLRLPDRLPACCAKTSVRWPHRPTPQPPALRRGGPPGSPVSSFTFQQEGLGKLGP